MLKGIKDKTSKKLFHLYSSIKDKEITELEKKQIVDELTKQKVQYLKEFMKYELEYPY